MSDLLKAVAVDGDPDMMYGYVPITKMDESSRMVYGIISGPDVDLDGQIVDQDWLRDALPKWMVYGNIRAQHDPKRPVGKAVELDLTHPDGPFLGAKIVDDDAWKMCREGVYSGFSVGIKGPQILKDPQAPHGRVKGRAVCEVSVVDHPSYYKAKMALVKSVDRGGWLDVQTGVVLDPIVPETPKGVMDAETRNDLDGDQFAVPSQRKLPINDAAHARNAAARLNQTEGLSDDEKAEAKRRIAAAIKRFGGDSSLDDHDKDDKMADPDSTTPAPDDAGKTAAPDLEKAADPDVTKAAHAHHYLQDDGSVTATMHHHGHAADGEYGSHYAEHKHCATCGDDMRVCGHGKSAKKDAEPDLTKASAEFVQAERADTITANDPGNAQGTTLKDVLATIESYARGVNGGNSVGFSAGLGREASQPSVASMGTTGNDGAGYLPDAMQQWHGQPSSAIKSLSADEVRALIHDELSKLFSGDDVLTKAAGASGSTMQAFTEAVEAIAAEKAATLVSGLEERLAKVEETPLPAKGVARAIEKSFALDGLTRPQRRMVDADVVNAVQTMDDDTQKKVAAAVFSQMYRQQG